MGYRLLVERKAGISEVAALNVRLVACIRWYRRKSAASAFRHCSSPLATLVPMGRWWTEGDSLRDSGVMGFTAEQENCDKVT